MLGRAIATELALRATPDAVLNAYGAGARAIELGGQVTRSAHLAYVGSSGIRTMLGRGHQPVVIAGHFLHGPGDRHAALDSLRADYQSLQADLMNHATSHDDAMWALADAIPQLSAFDEFYKRERASWIGMMLTDWAVFQSWQDKLVRIRELAKMRGIHLDGPQPVPLPETIWERGASGTGSDTDRWFTLAKYVVYAALGIVGFASLYAALRTVKHEVGNHG
jgi:hypothetical protein